MKRTVTLLGWFALMAVGFTACKKEDQQAPVNGIRQKIDYSTLNSSSNYLEIFKAKDGNQTVDFSGQTTRQDMLAEMNTLMSSGAGSTVFDSAKLSAMYANTGSPFTAANLNAATDKTLKSKTAGSFSAAEADAERRTFEKWFGIVATSSKWKAVAKNGQAGVVTANNGTSKYLVDEKGIEYGQLVQKGLIGAVLLDQMLNVYLGTEKMAADNKTVVNDKSYTQLEHHWDEAYGYMTKNGTFPLRVNGIAQERFLGGYLRQVADSTSFFLAFLKGRAAIANADYATRDAQITFIRNAAEKAIAMVAVSYLNKTSKGLASDPAAAMHAFAEGLGFVYSLRFAPNPKINKGKSEEHLSKLMGSKGFYSLTPTALNEVKKAIADTFGFSETYETGH